MELQFRRRTWLTPRTEGFPAGCLHPIINHVTSDDPEPVRRASPGVLKTVAVLGYCFVLGVSWWILQIIWPAWPGHFFRLWLPLVAVRYWIGVDAFAKHRYGIDLRARMTKAERRALGPRRKPVHCGGSSVTS